MAECDPIKQFEFIVFIIPTIDLQLDRMHLINFDYIIVIDV